MSKNIINIGIPSKGRLRKDILKIFKKNKLNLVSERGERDLLGSIKQLKNVKVLYLHAREIVERLGDGSLDLGFSGCDLLKESEVNIQNKINVTKIKIMSAKKDMTLTSVKVKSDLFENFKIECVKRKFSFQKLADRALFLYLTDEDFRKSINNQTNSLFLI